MRTNGSRTVLSGMAAALVALVALSGTARQLQAADDGAGPKQVACSYLGCPGTNDICAEVSAKVSIPGVGEVSVKYFCKEGEDATM